MAFFAKLVRSLAELIDAYLPSDNAGYDDFIDDLYELCGPGSMDSSDHGGSRGGEDDAIDVEFSLLDSAGASMSSKREAKSTFVSVGRGGKHAALSQDESLSDDVVEIDLNGDSLIATDALVGRAFKSDNSSGTDGHNAIQSNNADKMKKIRKNCIKSLEFFWKYSRICLAKLINAILFKSVASKLSPQLLFIIDYPFITLCGIILVYLLILVIFYFIYLTSLVIYPLGSFILFVILSNYLVSTIAGMISFVGSTTNVQSGMSKDYLKQFMSAYLSHCDQLSAFSTSVFKYFTVLVAHSDGSVDSKSLAQISQYANSLTVYSRLLDDLSVEIMAAANELRDLGMLRESQVKNAAGVSNDNSNSNNRSIPLNSRETIDNQTERGISRSVDSASASGLLEYDLYINISMTSSELKSIVADLKILILDVYSSPALGAAPDVRFGRIVTKSGELLEKLTLLRRLMSSLYPSNSRVNGSMNTAGAAQAIPTSQQPSSNSSGSNDLNEEGEDGSVQSTSLTSYLFRACSSLFYSFLRLINNKKYKFITIRNVWSHEKISFPLMRSSLVNKYGAIRVQLDGCSGNVIDGIFIPASSKVFDLQTRKNGLRSKDSTGPLVKSAKGLVLFLSPNAGFYETIDMTIAANDPRSWFGFYHSNGFDFATFNYRGYNLSEGTPICPLRIRKDGLLFAKHVITRYGLNNTRVIVHGQSMGGFVATYIAKNIVKCIESDSSNSSRNNSNNNSIRGINIARELRGSAGGQALVAVRGYSSVSTSEGDIESDIKNNNCNIVNNNIANSNSSSSYSSNSSNSRVRSVILVADRTFSSLAGTANRMILKNNLLGRFLKYVAFWNTSETIYDYMTCDAEKKIILQDPFDEIIAYPASLQVGVATSVVFRKLFHFYPEPEMSDFNNNQSINNENADSFSDYKQFFMSALAYLKSSLIICYSSLRNATYFDNIRCLSTQYNTHNYCGFDLPNRQKEDDLLTELRNYLISLENAKCLSSITASDISKLSDNFLDHFTACLRQLHICSKFEYNFLKRKYPQSSQSVPDETLPNNPPSNKQCTNPNCQNCESSKPASRQISRPDPGTHPSYPTSPWLKVFCNSDIDCSADLASTLDGINNTTSSKNYNSNNNNSNYGNSGTVMGVFQRAWVSIARIDGGIEQLLGQSLRCTSTSFGIDKEFAQGEGSTSSAPSPSNFDGNEKNSNEDINRDKDNELLKSSSSIDKKKGFTNYNGEGFRGHEKDSVSAWLVSLILWGSRRMSTSTSTSTSTSFTSSTYTSSNMPIGCKNLSEGIKDLKYMIEVIETLSHHQYNPSVNISQYNSTVCTHFASVLAYSKEIRKGRGIRDSEDNEDLRPGFMCPVMTTAAQSLSFLCESLSIINAYLVKCNSTSNTTSDINQGSTENALSTSLGVVLPIHSGHNGWLSDENVSSLKRFLN